MILEELSHTIWLPGSRRLGGGMNLYHLYSDINPDFAVHKSKVCFEKCFRPYNYVIQLLSLLYQS